MRWPWGRQEIIGDFGHGKRVLDPASCLGTWSEPQQRVVMLVPRGAAAGWAGQAVGFPPATVQPTMDMGLERTLLIMGALPSSEQSWIFLPSRESR